MPQTTLVFNTYEEADELRYAQNGSFLHSQVSDFRQFLRSRSKHVEMSASAAEELQTVLEKFHEVFEGFEP